MQPGAGIKWACTPNPNLVFWLHLVKRGHLKMRAQLSALLRKATAAAIALTAGYTTNAALAQGAPDWNIKAEHYACLMENIDAYLNSTNDKVVIFLQHCPETDLVKLFSLNTKNSLAVNVETVKDSEEQPAAVVTFTKKQLHCLRSKFPPADQGVMKIPQRPCD